MKVVAAEPSGHIDGFADGIQSWNLAHLHGFGRQSGGANAARCDLGLPLRARGLERQMGQALGGGVQRDVCHVSQFSRNANASGQRLGQPVG